MKLSEAMRAGALLVPRKSCGTFLRVNQYGKVYAACALGAALCGIYGTNKPGVGEHEGAGIIAAIESATGIDFKTARVPDSLSGSLVLMAIYDMNDDTRKTVPQIADWLQERGL